MEGDLTLNTKEEQIMWNKRIMCNSLYGDQCLHIHMGMVQWLVMFGVFTRYSASIMWAWAGRHKLFLKIHTYHEVVGVHLRKLGRIQIPSRKLKSHVQLETDVHHWGLILKLYTENQTKYNQVSLVQTNFFTPLKSMHTNKGDKHDHPWHDPKSNHYFSK